MEHDLAQILGLTIGTPLAGAMLLFGAGFMESWMSRPVRDAPGRDTPEAAAPMARHIAARHARYKRRRAATDSEPPIPR
jgi:hypothetical protein